MTTIQPIFLVIFGFVPSLIWLAYYLKKDCHPEPKSMIAKTLLIGILTAPLAVGAQLLFSKIATLYYPGYSPADSVSFFLWAAFVEEYVKYLAIKFVVLNNPEFDEPTDAMIYMISAALGFAALENVLVLFNAIPDGVGVAIRILTLRFVGATLLHTVSSALFGYFLGLAWFYRHHSKKLITLGLVVASFSHFVFNIALLSSPNRLLGFTYSTVTLLVLVILITFLFHRLQDRIKPH